MTHARSTREIAQGGSNLDENAGSDLSEHQHVSTLGSYWRKPNYIFRPHGFGSYRDGACDDYRKQTCLWIGGGFRKPQKQPIEAFRPLYIHNLPPSADRGELRGITSTGLPALCRGKRGTGRSTRSGICTVT